MEDEQFIEEVKRHEELYNKSSRDYINHTKKDIIWNEIGKKFNCDAKKKWKVLRDRYVREQKKIKDIPSGSAATNKPFWHLYALLQFLDDSIKPRRLIENNAIFYEEEILSLTEDMLGSPPAYLAEAETSTSSAVSAVLEERGDSSSSSASQKKRKATDHKVENLLVEALEGFKKRVEESEDDEDDLFLKIIKIKMSKMLKEDKILYKKEFMEKAEILVLKNFN